MKIVLGGVAFLIASCVAVAINGSSSWDRATQAEMARLSPASQSTAAFDADSLGDLPAPVARYFRRAITDGHAMVRGAFATQDAQFYLNGGWRRLQARQRFSVSPPGFVWDATIEMAPLMSVFVRDSYVGQRARMRASLYGIYKIVDQYDRAELNAGALQRFLGESIWFPTALLPSNAVRWQAHDDRSALVSLRDGGTEVTLLFEFGDDAMPFRISGDRYKEDHGQYAIRTWEISCGENAVRDGLSIPLRCEVAWINNGLREPYWRGRITSIEYQYDLME